MQKLLLHYLLLKTNLIILAWRLCGEPMALATMYEYMYPTSPTSGWRLRPLIIWRYVVPGTHIGSKTCQLRVVPNCRWSIHVCRLHYRRIVLASTTHPLTCSLLSCTHLLKSHICGGDWSQSNGTASHAAAAAIEASCSVTWVESVN